MSVGLNEHSIYLVFMRGGIQPVAGSRDGALAELMRVDQKTDREIGAIGLIGDINEDKNV